MATPKEEMGQAVADLVKRAIGTPPKPPPPPSHKIEVTDSKVQVHGGPPANFKAQIDNMLEQALDGALDGAAQRMGRRWSDRRIRKSVFGGASIMGGFVWTLNYVAAEGKLSAADLMQMTMVIGVLTLVAALVASAFITGP